MTKIQSEPQLPHLRDLLQPALFIQQLCAFLAYWWANLRSERVGHPCVVRATGEIVREQVPLRRRAYDLLLFSPLLEWLDRTQLLRTYLHRCADISGAYERDPRSKHDIKPFVERFGIDMASFDPPNPEAYTCFNNFFTRHLAEGARPLNGAPDDDSILVSCADARIVAFDSFRLTTAFWIKGHAFSLASLLGADADARELAENWTEGSVCVCRLSPQDYHRYHAPVRGRIKWLRHVPGTYYGVDPLAVRSDISVLDTNARTALVLDTGSDVCGDVLFVAIGANEVGSVKIERTVGDVLDKGDEIGLFQFGGSSIVIAFEKGRIDWDEDIREASLLGYMVDVKVREKIGRVICERAL